MKKIIKILILIVLIIFIFVNSSNALSLEQLDGSGADTGKIQNVGGQLITIISVIGSMVSVIALIVLGIKYMLGSVEERAQYKKTLMPYFIGAMFVFAASSIAGMIYNLF